MATGRTAAALHIPGKDNTVADALSRVSIRVRGLGPYPERELRKKVRSEVQGRCGAVFADVMASDDGRNAQGPFFPAPVEFGARRAIAVRPSVAVSQFRSGGPSSAPHGFAHEGGLVWRASAPDSVVTLEDLEWQAGTFRAGVVAACWRLVGRGSEFRETL